MSTNEQELAKVWWEMEEIEPLTPNTTPYHESNEIPTTVRSTQEEGVL